jgi:hypothetical protein
MIISTIVEEKKVVIRRRIIKRIPMTMKKISSLSILFQE